MTSINLAGKSALITGASSGIGKATAILFSRLGAQLMLTGRNKDNLLDTCSRCQSPVSHVTADMTNEVDVENIMSRTLKEYGKLDILVNNAGIQASGSIEQTSLAQYDAVMNANVRSVYQLTMLATPHLVKSNGNIVNVSSVGGLRAFPGILAYNISKSAIDQMTRCVALELASSGVRVNAVNPGVTVTQFHRRAGMSEEAYANFLERCKTTHPLGRAGTADETAETIAFLASDAASFITGVTLSVDGGRQALNPR